MTATVLAAAICRVSTPEQIANGSLPRQRKNVLNEANRRNALIPDNYWF